jgi:hypothetical protein
VRGRAPVPRLPVYPYWRVVVTAGAVHVRPEMADPVLVVRANLRGRVELSGFGRVARRTPPGRLCHAECLCERGTAP